MAYLNAMKMSEEEKNNNSRSVSALDSVMHLDGETGSAQNITFRPSKRRSDLSP